MAALNPQRLIFGLFLIVFVGIGYFVLGVVEHILDLKAIAWPAFMVMIFFFEAHMDIKKAPPILIGCAAGILCLVIGEYFVMALGPSLGTNYAELVFALLIVYLIVAFEEIVPMVFNNYLFMSLTVSVAVAKALVAGKFPVKPFVWLSIELIAGAIFIAGIMGIIKILTTLAMRKAAKTAQ